MEASELPIAMLAVGPPSGGMRPENAAADGPDGAIERQTRAIGSHPGREGTK